MQQAFTTEEWTGKSATRRSACMLTLTNIPRTKPALPALACTTDGVFVGEWLFVFPLCGFSLSLFCNYHRCIMHTYGRKTASAYARSLLSLLCLPSRCRIPHVWRRCECNEKEASAAVSTVSAPGRQVVADAGIDHHVLTSQEDHENIVRNAIAGWLHGVCVGAC